MPEPDERELLGRDCLRQVRVESFTAAPRIVGPSDPTSTISWRIRAPSECHFTFSLDGARVGATGTRTVQPTRTTTYTLRGRAFGIQRVLARVTVDLQFPAVPVKLSVADIQCFSQEDTNVFWPFDHEDDEPYVLCLSLNTPTIDFSVRPPRLDVELPRPRVVKVGPWADVDDEGQVYVAPPNTIWDADSGSLNTPDDAIFIAALVEQDNSDPETVRGIVEDLMVVKLLEHATSATNRNDFVRRMVDSMSWAVGFATTSIGSGGVIDPDDRIGLAQELPILQRDLQPAFAGGESTIPLSFRGDDADYRVRFRLSRM